MKPLTSEISDANSLQDLGRASVQVVHDLKNQLNGLKLYATFLRKRMEKNDRPLDEQETVAKLIAGLERAASDMTFLVRLGRPVNLRRQPNVDLFKLLERLISENPEAIRLEGNENEAVGSFDTATLTEAFSAITTSAIARRSKDSLTPLLITLRRDESGSSPTAIVEWSGLVNDVDTDPFRNFVGSEGIRLQLASRLVTAHSGQAISANGAFLIRLPLA
jgi:signal transduction histidine kinase